MQGQMPQEIEVWYIMPALRREIAKSLIKDFNFTQKQVAEYMGLTEAAVSQYLSSKRGKDVVFSDAVSSEIKKSAKRIKDDKNVIISEMMRLCNLMAVKKVMCDIHKKQDQALPKKCGICLNKI
ncbi:transcriptional regulator [archaeon]|jgi:hypothetical protein|nr:transcriptional regulator [archaeon]MDP6548334.1 transcriptional regulator [Candidatus Woesearchaeota archaeon]|tara:strand:+ start:13866 stop:14237 length:372 start_codon:yes stop_codon:yes gene_type:complete